MAQAKIQVVTNPSECGFFVDLLGLQITLTAIRATAEIAAHVAFSVSREETEETAVIEYTPQQFLDLIQSSSPAFFERLGITA